MALGPIELVILFGIPVATLVLLCWPVGSRGIGQWAAHHGLVLTPGNRPLVQHYLRTGRRLRVICVIGGIVLPPMIRSAMAPGTVAGAGIKPLPILIGYLVGTLWAELATGRPPADGPRTASLSTRRLNEYLPPVLRRALWTSGGAGAAIWGLAWLASRHGYADRGRRPSHASGAGTLAWMAVFVTLPVLVEAIQRWILRRPQPMVAPDLVAADDAIRSQSLHGLGGTTVAILLGCCMPPLFVISAATDQPVKGAAGALALLAFFAAIWFWRYYTNRDWRVERSSPTPPPAMPAAPPPTAVPHR